MTGFGSARGELRRLRAAPLRFVPPTVEHARIAAEARRRLPIHLGDCFAYALAVCEGRLLLTLDGGFCKTDVALVL